jgi:hypothetical protein
MFRGKADLLQRSGRYFARLTEAIVAAPVELWNLDVNAYDTESINLLMYGSRTS